MDRLPPLAALALLAAPAGGQTFGACPEGALHDSAASPEARLGWAVAIDGDTAVCGAPFGTGAAALSGVVVVHARTPFGWVAVDRLSASDGAPGDGFGNEVALQGNRLVVGSVWSDGPGQDAGAAYVFERPGPGGAFVEVQRLVPSDHAPKDWFGRTVDVDGGRIAVGASLKANPAVGQGRVYVFELAGSAWQETARLDAADGAGDDFFGGAIDLDGDRLLIGAHGGDALASESGGAYVFERQGSAWAQTAKLIAPDGQANDDLGIEVALAGNVALLASYGDDSAAADAGSVYVFERQGGAWTLAQELFASDAQPGDGFGSGVALAGDLAAIGAQDRQGKAGAAYAFRRGPGGFVEEARVDGAAAGALLGFDVAVAGDRVLAGAPGASAAFPSAGEARPARVPGDLALVACPPWLSLGAGGTHALALDVGPAAAGRVYAVGGSASGSAPGFALGAAAVPLNPDPYFFFTVNHANQGPFQHTLGVLDGAGAAQAGIALAPGTDPTLIGTQLVHAAVVIDPAGFAVLAATNAEPLALLP